MNPGVLKRIGIVLLFLPVCVLSPLIGLVQYICLGYVPERSPWSWLLGLNDASAQDK